MRRLGLVILLLASCDAEPEMRETLEPTTNPGPANMRPDPPRMCVDTKVYPDVDGDRFGVDDGSPPMIQCLNFNETGRDGYSRADRDCAPNDAWRNPGAEEICNDNLDDNCDGVDEPCPTTNVADLDIPNWDCIDGAPPSNVLAHALFESADDAFLAGGCFIVYEGVRDEFYVARVNLNRSSNDPSCEQAGCTCPTSGAPDDRRLLAVTASDGECPELTSEEVEGELRIRSNACRKFLYTLHAYDIPYTWFASQLRIAERRLEMFPNVEIACAQGPDANLHPFRSLRTTAWQTNAGFMPKPVR